MQRSKSAVSVEVKQVIGSLCKLLAATGLEAVPTPETFRRAKFGGGVEVESLFRQLLANILKKTGIVSSEACVQFKGDDRKLVAAGLWQTGYHAHWIYAREEREGEGMEGRSFSSKDLLLALGWLLATGTLENLLTQRVQQLDKTLLTSIPANTEVSDELQLDSASLRKLQWLIGNLRHQGRILLSMLEERTQLIHAVCSASVSSTTPSFSDQSSTVLKDDCIRMRQLCDLLEAYVNWKKVEKSFWTWMDSVVECHLSEPVGKRSTHVPNVSPRVCPNGNPELQKLEDMLLKLPTAQKGQRGCVWDTKDIGKERTHSGLDPSSLPLLFSVPSLPSLSQTYRARLQAEMPVRHSSYHIEGLDERAKAADELQASQAAQMLLQTEAQLLERRDRQRMANKVLLQEMIGRLDELVLIPP
ncbi:tubulin epsilon and delta complex protein 1 isoform X1 [Channa argus]|uniref:tubulin epsilon and delta complex protein 1 isoform X1 n=1 Tax=Channa argus TaxID=215402 RepID=UPI00294890B9|nr:hypothetical protein Q8A73_017130 [Channa argus]